MVIFRENSSTHWTDQVHSLQYQHMARHFGACHYAPVKDQPGASWGVRPEEHEKLVKFSDEWVERVTLPTGEVYEWGVQREPAQDPSDRRLVGWWKYRTGGDDWELYAGMFKLADWVAQAVFCPVSLEYFKLRKAHAARRKEEQNAEGQDT